MLYKKREEKVGKKKENETKGEPPFGDLREKVVSVLHPFGDFFVLLWFPVGIKKRRETKRRYSLEVYGYGSKATYMQ
jgi:hypothetical protein